HSLLQFLRVPYTYHSEGPPLELKRVFPFKEWWVIPFEYLPISVVKNRQILLYKGYGYIHAGYLFKGGIIGLYYQQFLKQTYFQEFINQPLNVQESIRKGVFRIQLNYFQRLVTYQFNQLFGDILGCLGVSRHMNINELHRNGPPCLQYMLTQMSYAEPIHYRNQARTKLYSILIGANISPQEIREWMRSYFQRLDKTSLVNFNRHMAKLETSLVY